MDPIEELRHQCKIWGWDFEETLAEYKETEAKKRSQPAPVAAAPPAPPPAPVSTGTKRRREPEPEPNPDARSRTLNQALDALIELSDCAPTILSTLYQDTTKPRSLDDATAGWEHVQIRGYDQTLVKDLAAILYKTKPRTPIGFIGDVATGKTLFCELFCSKYNYVLLQIQETDTDELKEWLELSINPSLLDTRPRLWVCEHWDAYIDTPAGRLLKKYFKKMTRTGMVICTAWTGFDTRVQTSGIDTWYRFQIRDQNLALRQASDRINIRLTQADATRVLEFAGSDQSAALATLQYFGGAPPPHLSVAKSMPPSNLRLLINQSLVDRSAGMMRLLAESDDLALTYILAEIGPEAQCAAAQCLTIERGNMEHDMWSCAGNLEQAWRVADAVSFCDAVAGYDGKIFKQFITGPLHSCIPKLGQAMVPLQIPTAQILWKQNQPQIKERQKKVMAYFGYGLAKDHIMSTFVRGREKKEEEDALDIYSCRVADSKAKPGSSVLLWSRDIADPRSAPDLRDRTLDLVADTWPERKHKIRVGGRWVEKSIWD